MKTILDETCLLYLQSANLQNNAECERLEHKITAKYGESDEAHKKYLEDFIELIYELIAEKEVMYFKSGFKYGMSLAMEAASPN